MEIHYIFYVEFVFGKVNIFVEKRHQNQHHHDQDDDPLDILSFQLFLDFRVFDILVSLISDLVGTDSIFSLLLTLKQFQNSNYSNNSDNFRKLN